MIGGKHDQHYRQISQLCENLKSKVMGSFLALQDQYQEELQDSLKHIGSSNHLVASREGHNMSGGEKQSKE